MKYLVVLGDGMADVPSVQLGNKTPLEFAKTPNMDNLATMSSIGLVKSVPDGFKPGSDVANLSVMGYAPEKFYSGRSPLEALSIGVELKDGDVAIRTNLVTLSGDGELATKVMKDYSAGEISTAEAEALVKAVQDALGNDIYHFYSGVSYRHCLVVSNGTTATELTPPHDITDKVVGEYLPRGERGGELLDLIKRSEDVLKSHPVNLARIEKGKNPATHVWFWGAGTKPKLTSFADMFGLKGAVISAVDLLKGIAVGAKMDCPQVEGATGTLSTNWEGKIEAVKNSFKNGADYVYLHMEAPDECGHQGDMMGKVRAIEYVDYVLGELNAYLKSTNEDYVIAVLPDHATPLTVKTHTREPIPYMIYKSAKPVVSELKYNEKDAQKGEYLPNGQCIITKMLETI
ncbi:MAG: cofactor-independent phosphoglycerate mutase [Clostridia bacterium]|nr:cofactor-independent phosphoglycerate mutase [Clostridia bacterium]